MDSTSLKKPVDLQGLSLALAKTKADYDYKIDQVSEQSDWEETDEGANAYIVNKPAIVAGEGENSVMIGQIEQNEDAEIYHLTFDYPTEVTDTITFTTEDDLSGVTATNLRCRLQYHYANASGSIDIDADYTYTVKDIDIVNSIITLDKSLTVTSSYTYSLVKATLYKHYKNALGLYSAAEGYCTIASGTYSHAEGSHSVASGGYSHAEGGHSVASGSYSHAEGFYSVASGGYSHAEGGHSVASGSYSHAEGSHSVASGGYSHAEGIYSVASGSSSHAEGRYTTANHRSQHVFGEFNIIDSSSASSNSLGNYIEIVGNGTSANNRSNAHTLDWSGNSWYAGKVSAGTVASPANPTAANDLTTKAYVDSAISGISDNNTTYTISISSNVITITGSDSSTSSITLPVYNGSVTTGGGS